MTLKQKETIKELKKLLSKKSQKKKVVVNKVVKQINFIDKELFQYVNCWAEMRSYPFSFKNGIRTIWGNGYKQACIDVYDKMEKLKDKKIRDFSKYDPRIAIRCIACEKYLGTKINGNYNLPNGVIQRGQGRNKPLLTFCNRECSKFFKKKLDIINPIFQKHGGKEK